MSTALSRLRARGIAALVIAALAFSSVTLCSATAEASPARRGRRAATSHQQLSLDITIPTDGTPLVLTPGTSQMGLAWGAGADNISVDHYAIRYATGGTAPANCTAGSAATGCGNTASLSCTHTGLSENTQYSYRVCAYDAASNSSTGLTGTSYPSDVTNPTDGAALTLTAGDTQIGLSWNAASDNRAVDHYEVRVAAGTQTPPANCNTGSTVTGCSDPSGTSCTATGLTNMTNYAFIVCAADAAGNLSTGLTATAQPFVDSLAWTFDGCDTVGGCSGTEEYTTVADNAVFECGAHLTMILIQTVATCVNGTTCDDFSLIKGTNGNDSYSILTEFNASGWVPRVAIGGLTNFGQTTSVLAALNRYTVIVGTFDGTQVDGGDGGSDANDERLDVLAAACDNATPPVCASLTDRALSFNGTIPTTITDQATAFTVGGVPATRYNLAGTISEAAIYCDGKVAIADVASCILDGTHARFQNLNAMSGACNAIFAHPVWWGRFGDKPSDSPTTQLGNGFANAIGNSTPNAMESGDQAAHNN